MAHHGAASQKPDNKCCGMVEDVREKREVQRNKPQPWIARKLAVFITIGIIGYTWYVSVGRLCVPMIRRDAGALGNRGMGIGFLVVFCILGLVMIWSYIKILLTSPGLAKDEVEKRDPPVIRDGRQVWWDTESEVERAEERMQEQKPPPPPPQSKPQYKRANSRHVVSSGLSSEPKSATDGDTQRGALHNEHTASADTDENAGVMDALPPVAAMRAKANHVNYDQQTQTGSDTDPETLSGTTRSQKPMMYTRQPSKAPILLPEYNYCHKDGFYKPYRAHHCRACGTCVLRYDHHCPWIGQCVGARNYRFFIIFVFWALIFCAWTFATLVGTNVHASMTHPNYEIDGQMIAIIAFAGFFCIFTTALLVTHVVILTSNMTTVEQFGVHKMRERENRVLGRLHAWWAVRARRQTRKQWDAEWGRMGKEGNMWWLGSARKNWEATMGDRVWMWFLPIGKSPDDGMSYMPSPRFNSEGIWQRRREWPKELQ